MQNLRKADSYLIIGSAVLMVVIGFLISAFAESHLLPILCVLVFGGLLAMITFFSPGFGFYVLVFSAMLNRYEMPVGGVELRIDQLVLAPILFGVLLRLTTAYLNPLYRYKRSSQLTGVSLIVIGGLVLHIVLNALSSFLFSPQPVESLKIVAWLCLSFTAM